MKKIWNDPVAANVIAGLILIGLVSFGSIFLPPVKRVMISMFAFSVNNPFVVSTLFLLVVVLFMSLRLKLNSSESFLLAFEWFSKLSDDQLVEYRFLFWFPIRHTLKTQKYYIGSETMDHVPEIRELIERRVLRNVLESVIFYSFEIDRHCYKYLEQRYLALPESERGSQLFRTFKSTEFIELFRKR